MLLVAHVSVKLTAERALGGERDAPRQLGLQGVKERFGDCIVAWPPDTRTLKEAELHDLRTERSPMYSEPRSL